MRSPGRSRIGRAQRRSRASWPADQRRRLLGGETSQGERPLTRLEVSDRQLGRTARRAAPVPGHGHGRPLADHVPSDPDPALPLELQTQTASLPQRTMDGLGQIGWLERQEPGPYSPGMGRQTPQEGRVADRQTGREVQHQQVDRPSREERPGQPEPLLGPDRPQDHEPAWIHAPRDRFERVEGPGQIQPGDDRAGHLGLRHAPKGERRLARGGVSAQRGAGPARQAARGQDRVQGRETGRDRLAGERRSVDAGDGTHSRSQGQGTRRARHLVSPFGNSATAQSDRGAPPARFEADQRRGQRFGRRRDGPGRGG
jgi:hypothetical protein